MTNAELAQALADAGYVSEADIEAAAIILYDALIIDEAEDVESLAMIDKAAQKQNVLDAELIADAATTAGDDDMAELAQDAIDEAFAAVVEDKGIINAAEADIADAYAEAAAALLAAELIDEANAPAVAAMLAAAMEDED